MVADFGAWPRSSWAQQVEAARGRGSTHTLPPSGGASHDTTTWRSARVRTVRQGVRTRDGPTVEESQEGQDAEHKSRTSVVELERAPGRRNLRGVSLPTSRHRQRLRGPSPSCRPTETSPNEPIANRAARVATQSSSARGCCSEAARCIRPSATVLPRRSCRAGGTSSVLAASSLYGEETTRHASPLGRVRREREDARRQRAEATARPIVTLESKGATRARRAALERLHDSTRPWACRSRR